MVVWGLAGFTDALQKRLCRFLIHRYLSDFLKSSINLEQLSATLYGGVASVSDVDMDVQRINEALDSMKVPFTAVEGYIGEVNITVPWQEILRKSVDLEVKQMQLTLQLQRFTDEPPGDIVASMFGSVVGSLATSMELAQSFLNQEESTNEAQEKGVEQFAEVIDAVISRFRLTFNDATIRLEGVPDPESGLCTALELRIDWIELIDEQLESDNGGTITSQPHSLSAVPDFNKLFNVKGIRLYTDIFTMPEMRDLSDDHMSASTQVITSMYLRREKEKTKKKLSASSDSSDEHYDKSNGVLCSMQSTTASAIYESCYSHQNCADDELTSSTSSPLSSSSSTTLESNPVLFASFTGKVGTVVVRVRNNEISSQGTTCSVKEINLNFDGLCVFLTPSQLSILKTFFAAIARPSSNPEGAPCIGKPMGMQDYQQVEAELQTRIAPSNQVGTDFQHGNWGGSMMFYDAQRKPSVTPIGEQMANVSLNLNDSGADATIKISREVTGSDCSSRTMKGADAVSDMITVKASICNVIFVLTHKDYLGQDEVRDRAAESIDSIADVINSYKELVNSFFKTVSSIRLGLQLNELRRITKHLYGNDHLRFIGEAVAFDYSQLKREEFDSFSMNLEALDGELLEILSPASSSTGSEEHIKLFSFCDNASTAEKSRRLMVKVDSGKNSQPYNVTVNLATCESELDITIIDRISSLLVTKPFHTYPFPLLVRNTNNVSRGLKTDFLFTAMQDANNTSSTTMSFTLYCPEWDVNLRIPVTDLRHAASFFRMPVTDLRHAEPSSSTRPPYWERHLHKEMLRLTLLDARLEIPTFDTSRLGQYGTVIISASTLNGSFNLDEKFDSTGIDSLFLYAGCSETCGGGCVSMKLSYDNRNTSLKTTSVCNVADYACTSQFDVDGETVKVEGPFSKCIVRNENRMVIVIGSTKEMLELGESCITNAKISCELTIPVLRVHLPSRHYYEIIYNRLANDLAMWQPASPVFSSTDRQRDREASVEFKPCKSPNRKSSANSESNISGSHQSTLTINTLSSEKSHDFCLLANINDGRLLIGTEFGDEATKQTGQVGTILQKTQMMVVNGFHGNKELSYFYSTSKTAHLFHKNFGEGVRPYERCVLKKDFAEHLKEGIQAEPVVDEEICLLEEEDNFAIAIRIDYLFMENIKNMLVGIGIRNTTLQLQPYQDTQQFWVNQVINFFDVADYGIPGYELPQITTELHVHLSSSLLAYEHSFVNPSSPLSLRVMFGSCNVSSRIMQDLELYKFECIFEQLKLFASCNRNACSSGNQNESKKFFRFEPKFIQMLSVGMLQLEVMAAKSFATVNGKSERRFPLLEVRCKNDLLKVWACSDSLCTVINAIGELLNAQTTETHKDDMEISSDILDSEKQSSSGQQLSNLEKLVQSAVSQPAQSENSEYPAFNTSPPGSFMDKTSLLSSAMQDLSDPAEKQRHRNSFGTLGTDEGFCLIEEIPGSGIVAGDGMPRARLLDADDTPSVTVDNYLTKIDKPSDKAVHLAMNDNHVPLVKYCIDDVSLDLHLYGGTDFGTTKPPPKPYSMPNGGKPRRDQSPVGGRFRDYSSHVELFLSKVKFIFEVYNENAPAISTRLFSVGSVEILDKMMSSKINKLLYPHVCEQSFPRHSQSPMFSVRLYETPQHEGKMKVSLLPVRINADQDTLEFMEDYINDLSGGVTALRAEYAAVEAPTKPILEVRSSEHTNGLPYATNVNLSREMNFMNAAVQDDLFLNGSAGCHSETRDDEEHLEQFLSSDLLNLNTDDDFHLNEDDGNERPESASHLFDESGPITGGLTDLMDTFCYPTLSPYSMNPCSSTAEEIHDNIPIISSENTNNENLLLGLMEEEKKDDEETVAALNSNPQCGKITSEMNSHIAGDSISDGKIFFKEFTFSPSTMIRLDLTGKRMRPDQGWFLGFLVGLSDFKCTEIRLTELNACRGLLGYEKCVKFAIENWLHDINNRQLAQFVTTYGPIKSLVEVGLGIRDLFLMPVNEYCREEGHVVKGLQRGAESFGISTATAAVDMLQRMVGVVQSVAELAFDIVSPEYPIYRHRRNMIHHTASRPPNDIRDGFNMALEAIGQEISETAQDFQIVAQEDQACGYSTMRGFLRQAPTTVIRPIVAMSRATAHILGGLRNQMKPDSYREEMEKWK